MIFIEKMKNLKIYKTKTFLPTIKGDKKKGSAVLLMTPNIESSQNLMNNSMFVNNGRFASYYLERDVSYYINSKVVDEVDDNEILKENAELQLCMETKRSELKDSDFGVPSKRKFPLDTEKHVRSAIKFFNYVDPEDEEELANNILAAMNKFNIDNVSVSEKNRFSKYYKSIIKEDVLQESRILTPLDLRYFGWKFGTIPEDEARLSIFDSLKDYSNIEVNSPEDVPTPDEYFDKYANILFKDDFPKSEELVRNIPESTLNLGDKVMFFNESNVNDTQLKRLLYRSRIRYRKDLMNILDNVKKNNPQIKYTYPNIEKYIRRNLFVDLYYYNSIFFQNNTWVYKKGMNLYTDLMTRLLNHPNLKQGGYTKKTIFIPISDWDTRRDGTVWNYRMSLNPISCIYNMLFTNMLATLKNTFGDTDIIFTGSDKYFKLNFSQIDPKDIKKVTAKFKIFCVKICKGEEFDAEDVDYSSDNKEDAEVIQAKIVDKIELVKGIDITKQVSKANDIRSIANKNIDNLSKGKPVSKYIKTAEKKLDNINNKSIVAKNSSQLTPQTKDIKDAINKSKENKKIEMTADNISKAADNDPDFDNDNSERDANIDKLADAIAKASDNSYDDEEAMDILDTEEIKKLLVSLGNDDEVNISASRASRMSKLNDELLDKEVKGKSIRDILDDKDVEDNSISVDVAGPNKDEWSQLSYANFDKDYKIDRDIINIFKFFSTCSRPIVVRDIKVTDNSTSEDRVNLYEVDMEDYRGKRYKIKLDIPIMEDNRFLLRGNNKSIQTQFFNMPIIKTDLGTCQLISNYKKIFLYRFGDTKGKSLPATSKLIKAAGKYAGRKIKFVNGDNTKVCAKYNLPIDYIDLAGTFSKIETEDFIIYFNQDEIRDLYAIENGKGFPFAFNKKLNAVEYFSPDIEESFVNYICEALFKICPDFQDLFATVTRSTICAYSRASIMSAKIPVAIICGYHIGLSATMDRAGIKYEIVDKLSKEIKTNVNKDWIEFNDGYIVYDVDYESSLLMNGLKSCSTDMYNLDEIDNKTMYLEFLDNYGGRIKADGLDNFYDLFVDPMIKESLEYYHLPTNYIDILLYGSSMLADNKYIKHVDTSSRRLRRYQLISVYTYQVLSTAYGSYSNQLKHSKQSAEFSVKQSAVIDAFLTDTISSDDSCINALRDVETTNAITTKGPSGMNADRAYSLDKRAYDESMVNVLGMSTGFAGNVGITRQATINSNVTPDGYVKQNDGTTDNMNDANTLTATESLIPFGSTRDDPMRTAMSFIQTAKHMVRTEDSDPLLVTSGADEVMPYLTTDKFAFKAKDNGIILEITDEYMLVEYSDGSKDYINLRETTEKNSDGGYFVPLKLDKMDGLEVGTKITKNQILAYDKYSFSNSLGESNNLAYNIGKLAKIAIVNSDEGFEDSGIISDSMAKKLATRVELKYDSVINKDATIYKIAKIGDHIEASDDLLVWEDAFDDEDADSIISALDSDSEYSDLGKRKLKSEVTGILKDIKIYRTVELDELSPSIKKIVSDYEKPLKELAKKLKDNNISISKVPAHYVLPPTGKLKRAQEAIIIEFYVEYLDTVGIGDKIVYNSANKAVEKDIFPIGEEPYTDFRPNEKIDAFVSVTSISKRLVSSTLVYGGLQKLMVELDRSVKDIMGIPYDDSSV